MAYSSGHSSDGPVGALSGTSYGIAGLLMLAVSHRLYRAEDRAERLALVACLLAVIPALNLATSDAAAVAGLVMTVLTVGLVSCAGKSLPRFWRGFSRYSTPVIWLCWAFWRRDGCGIFDRNRMIRQRQNTA
ncbi:F-pilin acetylation protein TraX (modular protein) (plasmid) [Escherichia coli]|nr:F-pilin acetylation protein TraX (modular protein) [Escherichia coli]